MHNVQSSMVGPVHSAQPIVHSSHK